MPQFFIDKDIVPGSEMTIGGGEAHHITHVLRLSAGDWIVLSDGKGHSFKAHISKTVGKGVCVTIGREVTRSFATRPPTLAAAVIRGKRFEWMIEKAVELGINEISPFVSKRSIEFARGDLVGKVARWTKIATSAAKQSGLPFIPKIGRPQKFEELCESTAQFSRRALFYEGESPLSLQDFLRAGCPSGDHNHGMIIIGPEGGFDASEIEAAKDSGMAIVGLGQQILRAETAAIAAITIWQYESGNLNTYVEK
jgi:16S rRNA (uracil1498-N3)-methyltransferase